jgi:rhodanese-related sulfurtransferase
MSAYPDLTVSEAHDRIDSFVVVDVRGVAEFDGPLGRVPGSRLIPLGEVEARSGELRGAGALLLVCRSGNRSGLACQKLIEAGIHDVANLAGGMIAWNEEELPVEQKPVASGREIVDQLATWLGMVTPLAAAEASDAVAAACRDKGSSPNAPGQAALVSALERANALATQHGDPADRKLVITSLRRSLETL